MHSISTSVLSGNVLTATHLVTLATRNVSKKKKSEGGGNIRSAGLNITPILHIDGVHLGEVIHIGQKHVHFDDLVDVRPSFFEDVG